MFETAESLPPLRPYQQEAIANIESELETNPSTLLVMATGTGKTRVFTHIAHTRFRQRQKPILVLAHRAELLQQAQESFGKAGLKAEIEKADQFALAKSHDAVIASVQSISRPERLKMYPADYFDLLITDESHHSVGSTYRRIYDHFQGIPHLGVTATPNRHDEIGLKNVYKTCAFQYSIMDGIKDGYLCNVVGKQIQVEGVELEKIKIVAGEFSQPELDVMLREEKALQGMVKPTIKYAENRPTIVFTTGVEHAHEIAACFNRIRPGSAVAIDGQTKDSQRQEAIDRFRSGRCQYIVNVGVLTEGFDHPPTACIALFRPTRSLGLLAQMVGRGTRIADGKDDCLVLDFVGVNNTVRTMTVMDVLDGSILSEREHKKAQELQEEGMAAAEALTEAKAFIAHLDALHVKTKAYSSSFAFDVIAMFEIPSCKGKWGGDKVTPKQKAALENFGITVPATMEKGEAHALLDRLFKRIDQKKCTIKQLRYARRLGLKGDDLEDWSFTDMSNWIGAHAPKWLQKTAKVSA